jgi:hypothetical protein
MIGGIGLCPIAMCTPRIEPPTLSARQTAHLYEDRCCTPVSPRSGGARARRTHQPRPIAGRSSNRGAGGRCHPAARGSPALDWSQPGRETLPPMSSMPKVSAADRRKLAALVEAFRRTRSRLPRAEEVARAMGWPLALAERELPPVLQTPGEQGTPSPGRPSAQSNPPPPRQRPPADAGPTEAPALANQPKRPPTESTPPPPGTPEANAYEWLQSQGQNPTPAAVANRLAALKERQVSGARRAERQARRAAELAMADGPRAREWVAGVRAATGAGPTWRELTAAMGWPHDRRLRELIMGGCADAGYLVFERRVERSLRPGLRAD